MGKLVLPITWLLGVIFIVIGVLGFVTGSPLIVFEVDSVHNVVHLLSGVIALICAAVGYKASKGYLIVFGLSYGLVSALGFLRDGDILGLLHMNTMDNYLHLGISVVALFTGLFSSPEEEV